MGKRKELSGDSGTFALETERKKIDRKGVGKGVVDFNVVWLRVRRGQS